MSEKESKAEALKNIGARLNDLRQNKPKLFYGGIAGLFAIVLLLLLSGGGGDQSPRVQASLTIGERYRLVNPNGGEVLLVAVPGQFSSVDYKEDDSQNICAVNSGTRVALQEETFINYINYVKVQPLDGPCKGKAGWTSKVNIKK